jgi:hypothetical protein
MPGDPKECREHASRCAELAVKARTPQLRATFLELSKELGEIAIQLEDLFAKLAESEDVVANVRRRKSNGRFFKRSQDRFDPNQRVSPVTTEVQ